MLDLNNNKFLGSWGEEKAVEFLKNKGYKIIAKNYRLKIGEIDIIAKQKDIIVFVEVKTIKRNKNFMAQDKVDFSKRKKLKKLCEIYLKSNRFSLNTKWQIDVVAVEFFPKTKDLKIYHFKNAISGN